MATGNEVGRFQVPTLIYKAFREENCPDNLRTMFPLYTPTRNLRSSNDPCGIDVPTTKITMATGVLLWWQYLEQASTRH